MESRNEAHYGVQERRAEFLGNSQTETPSTVIVTEISETGAALRAVLRPPLVVDQAGTTITNIRIRNNGRWFLTPIGIDNAGRHREFSSRRIRICESGQIIGLEEGQIDADLLSTLNENYELRSFLLTKANIPTKRTKRPTTPATT